MSQIEIRQALKTFPDGLNITEIARIVSRPPQSVVRMIALMFDVYIDRWVKTKRGPAKYTPVYLLVDVPEDAPMPD